MAGYAYTGALLASVHPHFSLPNSVPGVSPTHGSNDPGAPDLFNPTPGVTDPEAEVDVFQPADVTPESAMQVNGVSHWANLQDPVPMNVPSETAGIAFQERFLVDHSHVDFRPDTSRKYHNATEGRSIEYVGGPMPWQSGEELPDNLDYLVMGTNAYDQTNLPNEVYAGDPVNVGRYRLGYTVNDFGHYEFWTKQGQDGMLRAYTGLTPQVPVDKAPIENPAPYTPNSSGTATWLMPSTQTPSNFSLPSETSMTDYEMANGDVIEVSQFTDGGRM